jgi:hypothetical protein
MLIGLSKHCILRIYAGLNSATFTIVNKCSYPVWPGILSGAGTAQLATTGFALQQGESNVVTMPTSWSSRIWGRTLCSTDPSGKFSCITGDCGSSNVECTGSSAIPPATLAEFTLNGANGLDFYDVSLVDGYNLPITVEPSGGGGNCTTTGCLVDLNGACPSELKVKIAAEGEESSEKAWPVKARVKLLVIQCIVAMALMQLGRLVSQVHTRSSSRARVHALIAMLMMMELAPSLVPLQITSLLSVLHIPKGNVV